MALKDLFSDLSFYGTKNPGPYIPPRSTQDTKFTNDKVPAVAITGYSSTGETVGFRQAIAQNSFVIDNVSLSSRGNASREAQGGSGFPFLQDTGFSSTARYEDAVKKADVDDNKPVLQSGLAFKYTKNSPIDDMYNKFKIREDSYNPGFGPKQPFILRGIQQDGRTEPQRFGIGFDEGSTRGGIITAAERIALDAVRIGKYLIKPQGIAWMARNVGMQLSNPNTEDASGKRSIGATKVFTPINLLANVVGSPLGLRFQRHGVAPSPTVGRYEDILNQRADTAAKIEKNRLHNLLKELQPHTTTAQPASDGVLSKLQKLANKLGFPGQGIKTLSGPTGPGSLYGIGTTNIRRVVDTSYQQQLAGRDKGLDGFGLGKTTDHFIHTDTTKYFISPLTTETEDLVRKKAKDNLKTKFIEKFGVTPLTPYFGTTQASGPLFTAGMFVLPFLIDGAREGELKNAAGDPFSLRNKYTAAVEQGGFLLTGLSQQLARPNLSIFDGSAVGITEQSILSAILTPNQPYWGVGLSQGAPGVINARSKPKSAQEAAHIRFKLAKMYKTAKFARTGLTSQIANSPGQGIPGYGTRADHLQKTNNKDRTYTSGTSPKITGPEEQGVFRSGLSKATKLKKSYEEAKSNRFIKTGLEAQLEGRSGGIIPGYGAQSKIENRLNTREEPYFGDTRVNQSSVAQDQPGSTPDEREDNLRAGKQVGKKLKDQANTYSKGTVNPDGSVNITGTSNVDNAPEPANTATTTAAGNNIKTVQHYASMAYGNLQVAARNRAEGLGMIDFREPILQNNDGAVNFVGKTTDGRGNESTLAEQDKTRIYNVPEPGKAGRDRSLRLQNNVPDPINAHGFDLGSSNSDPNLKDFINFKFYPLGVGDSLSSANDPIQFRAYIDSLSDAISPTWQANNDQGRADAKIMLESWERSIDLTFRVAAGSGAELQALYNKMEALALLAYPDYTGTNGFVGRYVKVHIGDLYRNEPMYIDSISFDWDNETPWELDDGLQVPYYTTVTLSLGWIGNMRPDASKTKVFSVRSKNAGSRFSTANSGLTRPNEYRTVR